MPRSHWASQPKEFAHAYLSACISGKKPRAPFILLSPHLSPSNKKVVMRFAASTEAPSAGGRVGEPGWPAHPPPGPDWPSSPPRDALADGFMLFWLSVVIFLMGCHIVLWFREKPEMLPNGGHQGRLVMNQAADGSWQAWPVSHFTETTPLLLDPGLPPYEPNPPANCPAPPRYEPAPPPYESRPGGNNTQSNTRRWQSV